MPTRMPFSANSLAQLELIPGPPPTTRATSRTEGRVSPDSDRVIFHVPVLSLRGPQVGSHRHNLVWQSVPIRAPTRTNEAVTDAVRISNLMHAFDYDRNCCFKLRSLL